tara:strand:- start:62 stop:166 length:105 start_codon:yes stop_codon:yes gene_type:complete
MKKENNPGEIYEGRDRAINEAGSANAGENEAGTR